MQKVRVSETPGKTKHFQTLPLTEDITLCDCPGLVMPSIANSKAGMVLQVIVHRSIDLSISQLFPVNTGYIIAYIEIKIKVALYA